MVSDHARIRIADPWLVAERIESQKSWVALVKVQTSINREQIARVDALTRRHGRPLAGARP